MIHENQPVKTAGIKLEEAEKVVIMVHGRGATAESILGLKDQLPDAAFLAPQAANRTWYPKSFLELREQNQPHLDSALEKIGSLVEKVASTVGKKNVYLLGFSQGACLSSEYAARNPQQYGGVIVFSGGLIGQEIEEYNGNMDKTSVYLCCSENDPHIPQKRVDDTVDIFKGLNADVEKQIFKGSSHTVNQTELEKASEIINQA